MTLRKRSSCRASTRWEGNAPARKGGKGAPSPPGAARRDQDPEKIAEPFIKGAEKAGKKLGKNLFKELDRKQAIKKALELAKKDDIVLILGKGHEKTILRADGPHEFEDIKVTRQFLKKL